MYDPHPGLPGLSALLFSLAPCDVDDLIDGDAGAVGKMSGHREREHDLAVRGVQYLIFGFYRIARKPVNWALLGHRVSECRSKFRFT